MTARQEAGNLQALKVVEDIVTKAFPNLETNREGGHLEVSVKECPRKKF